MVHILFRSSQPRALPLLLDRCRMHPDISIHENSQLADFTTKVGADEIMLKTLDTRNGQKHEIVCQLILTAIGRAPALHFLDPDLRAAIAELQLQKIIFLVGDVGNGRYRQAAIAAADGLRAALEINADK
jgi:thioredoxin reductase